MSHILIIDDSTTATYITAKRLERKGFKVTMASDGLSGFTSAQMHRPDVIIMDLIMPGMDGFQATRKFKSNDDLKNIPIVIHSSKNMPLDRKWAEKQGAVGYVDKPATIEELIKAIAPFLKVEG